MNIDVVHHSRYVQRREVKYIYVGRPPKRVLPKGHFGNPFSHHKNSRASVMVDTREDAIKAFEMWLDGEAYQHVEPERRLWILDHMQTLASVGEDLVLGCWCVPQACHAQVIAVRILTYRAAIESRPGEDVIITETEREE